MSLCFLVTTVFQSVTTVCVCHVQENVVVAMGIEGAFPPDTEQNTLGLEEQHLLPWIWGLCWSEPCRAQPWFV